MIPELRDDIGRYAAGSIDLMELCENFRQTLARNPNQRVDSAIWLSQSVDNGRISTAVCESLREVLTEFEPPAETVLTQTRDEVAPSVVPRLSVGSFLGTQHRYELESLLGEGGMGQVFKARDHLMNSTVALKVLGENFSQNPDAYRALQNETRRAQELQAPNVVKVFNFDQDGAIAFMLMEYLEGETLEQTLRDRDNRPMSVAEAWPILNCIGTALAAAHEQQLVHSDLKPSNVFICRKGTVKVLDFGIARQYRTSADATIASWGAEVLGAYTPPYASLEQILGQPADPRDDIYAFGCVAYRILSGAHPFGETRADLAMRSKLAPSHLDQLSGRQWQALRHTLAFKRDDRTANIRDFLSEFEPPGLLRRFRVPIVLLGLALASGAVYLSKEYFRDYYEGQMLGIGRGPAAHKVLTPEQQRSVDDDLFLAKDYLSGAKVSDQADELAYVLSEGANNVNQILDSVLEKDPGDAQALAMKVKIAALYLEKARLEMRAGNTKSAAAMIRNGRKTEPANRELYRLQQEVCNPDPSVCAQAQN